MPPTKRYSNGGLTIARTDRFRRTSPSIGGIDRASRRRPGERHRANLRDEEIASSARGAFVPPLPTAQIFGGGVTGLRSPHG
jgi:hypothetical protein